MDDQAQQDQRLGAAIRRIAQRFPKYDPQTFLWYVDQIDRDAAGFEAIGPITESTWQRVHVEPAGPPHVDGVIERLLEMLTSSPAGVSSPITDQVIAAREALAELGITPTDDTGAIASEITGLGRRLRDAEAAMVATVDELAVLRERLIARAASR